MDGLIVSNKTTSISINNLLIAYMSSPCHIELILTEKEEAVPKLDSEVSSKKVSKKKLKRLKMKEAMSGGGD